jgi:ABC-type amino acid transport substrate-binding protein
MRLIQTTFTACMAAAMIAGLAASAAGPARAAEPTLAAVKKRGVMVCGINGQLPGFSAPNEN